jgi:hypothetical protein
MMEAWRRVLAEDDEGLERVNDEDEEGWRGIAGRGCGP